MFYPNKGKNAKNKLKKVVGQDMLQVLSCISVCCFDLTVKCRTSKLEIIWFDPSVFFSFESYGDWCNDITSEHDNWHRSSHWPSEPSALLTEQPIIRAHRQLFKVLPCHLSSLMKTNGAVAMVRDDTGVCWGLTSTAKETYSCAENF